MLYARYESDDFGRVYSAFCRAGWDRYRVEGRNVYYHARDGVDDTILHSVL